ncbi:hypothetical protein ACSFA0_14875 [Variovorax sp. LT1P1]|uniref:hypothetical protein n=1 Tax=Variovorax sp. LT1P1 TaxID=3443730 RepID=UPI003F47386A
MSNTRSLTDPASLDALRDALEHSAADLAEHRAYMIEALGDRLCGSGPGPQPADTERLERLERTHRARRLAYAEAMQLKLEK